MTKFPVVGVIGKRTSASAKDTLWVLCPLLRELGAEVLIEDGDHMPTGLPGARVSRDELAKRAKLAIVVGGDGTLLNAGRSLAPAGVPVLGINQGRLGFMVDVAPDSMRETLAAVMNGEYEVDDRTILSARVRRAAGNQGGPYIAINDVVFRNQATIRMLEFETWLDQQFISLHRADGMIVSSPTGSTAYALSGGGPILHPSLSAISLVPICPHTLSDRPIVVSGDRTVRLVMGGSERISATATFDGQYDENLLPGDSVEIQRAPFPLRLIHPRGFDYFAILRDKLRWGRGQTPTERA
ncbi:MAG TPA: NAD(+) kinase [Nevskiaceae bacterium]|nr:NAD(+) kinase [Nevskiaceae bacterium]